MIIPNIWKVIKFHGFKPPTSIESIHVGTYMWVLWVFFMFVGGWDEYDLPVAGGYMTHA